MSDVRSALASLDAEVADCRRCPRLVEWRERVAREKRASFRDDAYWGRPVPSFGPGPVPVWVVGLAPAAHGANRTGRMFTGDRSGDWLFRALHRAGFASQPEATSANDGLTLDGIRITAAVHCAPPDNKPTPAERKACRPFLEREFTILRPHLRVIVALGGFAWNQTLRVVSDEGVKVPVPRPKFGHGVEVELDLGGNAGPATLLGSFHPSQQNTFTGRLTEEMFDAVWSRARELGGR